MNNDGNQNDGNQNAGNQNAGDLNAGDLNAGYYNAGDYNVGDLNAGNYNVGNRNAGNQNAGDRNAGDLNAGYYNAGDYNVGDQNTGFFCVGTPDPVFFDKPVHGMTWIEARNLIPCFSLEIGVEFISQYDMTDQEKADHPNYETVGGYLKKHTLSLDQSFPKAWEKMDDETRRRFKDLPNFDADKFLEITGVDVRESNTHMIVVNGKSFEVSDELIESLLAQLVD